MCGSTHHPSPASSYTDDIPTEGDLKAAKEQYAQLEREKSEAQLALFKAQSVEKGTGDRLEEVLNSILEVRGDFTTADLEVIKNTVSYEKQQLQRVQDQWLTKQNKLERIDKNIEKQEKLNNAQAEKLHQLKQ